MRDKLLNGLEYIVGGIVGILPVMIFIIGVKFSEQYYDNGNNTASKGIIFIDTIDLTQYKLIGSGENILCLQRGGYDIYTRSAMHEVVVVCKPI